MRLHPAKFLLFCSTSQVQISSTSKIWSCAELLQAKYSGFLLHIAVLSTLHQKPSKVSISCVEEKLDRHVLIFIRSSHNTFPVQGCSWWRNRCCQHDIIIVIGILKTSLFKFLVAHPADGILCIYLREPINEQLLNYSLPLDLQRLARYRAFDGWLSFQYLTPRALWYRVSEIAQPQFAYPKNEVPRPWSGNCCRCQCYWAKSTRQRRWTTKYRGYLNRRPRSTYAITWIHAAA